MSENPPQSLFTSLQQRPTVPFLQTSKRTRGDHDDTRLSDKSVIKRRKRQRVHPEVQQALDLDRGINVAIGRMDARSIRNYVAQHTIRLQAELSAVELENLLISESAFRDTSDWTKPRLLEHLPEFLDHYSSLSDASKKLATASQKLGAPHTLVIVSAALRAANVARALRKFQAKDAAVAKLFAKHIKLKDAVEFVKKTRIGIGVGTPSRIFDLFNAGKPDPTHNIIYSQQSGALCFEKLERVVVDCSHIDVKKRCIFDMRETQKPLLQLLSQDELKSRYGGSSNRINVLFF
ncbi:hypothetical protein MMC07_008573 [Pseudocyphellaria aurata]|nr:hypothetical protein [Pseudocyphellaria aurata]